MSFASGTLLIYPFTIRFNGSVRLSSTLKERIVKFMAVSGIRNSKLASFVSLQTESKAIDAAKLLPGWGWGKEGYSLGYDSNLSTKENRAIHK